MVCIKRGKSLTKGHCLKYLLHLLNTCFLKKALCNNSFLKKSLASLPENCLIGEKKGEFSANENALRNTCRFL